MRGLGGGMWGSNEASVIHVVEWERSCLGLVYSVTECYD